MNVDNSEEIGSEQMKKFENSLPEGFHQTISKQLKPMSTNRKSITIAGKQLFNTEMLYARFMIYQSNETEMEPHELLSYELAPIPTSMFKEDGKMRESKKSDLKNEMKVTTSSRTSEKESDVQILDGCAELWVIPWANTVDGFLINVRKHIQDLLQLSPVYLIFDRYWEGSIKESTREGRDACVRLFDLHSNSPLPARKSVLTSTYNKRQLINLIVEDLRSHASDVKTNKLVVTGDDPVPIEINKGVVSERRDMRTEHEEADNIIIQQASSIQAENILVRCDDTDVFVLLLHFMYIGQIKSKIKMISPQKGRDVIDMSATLDKHIDIVPYLLLTHAITGCDTVAAYSGISKNKALKILCLKKYEFCDNIASLDFDQFLVETSRFILACYGQSCESTMSLCRQKIWKHKIGRSRAIAPKLASLPPTDETFEMNARRAFLQFKIWLSSVDEKLPNLDPTVYGWTVDQASKSMMPTKTRAGVSMAPEKLLKLSKCTCEKEPLCKSARCGCNRAELGCSEFCSCFEQLCCNPKNVLIDESEDDSNCEDDDSNCDDII